MNSSIVPFRFRTANSWSGRVGIRPVSNRCRTNSGRVNHLAVGNHISAQRLTVKVMRHRIVVDIIHRGQMKPSTRQRRIPERRGQSLVVPRTIFAAFSRSHRKVQLPGIQNLPVRLAFVVIVCQKQRVESSVQTIDPHPRTERERAVFAGNVNSNPISGPSKFQTVFRRPPAINMISPNNGTIQFGVRWSG